MLTLTIDCSYHQKDDDGTGGYGKQEEVMLETIDDTTRRRIEKHLKSKGWVVQYNGNNMDTYCSKKCAE